jgi:inositol-hexakisphosphate kinase
LYGSSLLILYDGHNGSNLDIRLIDFARCVTRKEIGERLDQMTYPPLLPMEPDHGYLIGLQSIIQALENILAAAETN